MTAAVIGNNTADWRRGIAVNCRTYKGEQGMNRSIKTVVWVFSVVVAFAGVLLPGASNVWAQQKAGGFEQQIAGTWSLTAQYVEQDGKKTERFGPNPKGIAIYERNGRFAAILLSPDLPKFASNNAMTGTADENKAVVQRSTAYYGTWSANEKDHSISSHIDGSTYPNWDGLDQKRTVSISGDEMKFCVPGAQIGGGTACAVWKRVK